MSAAEPLRRSETSVLVRRQGSQFWHGDPLRRRMLALADLAAGLGFVATYGWTQQLPLRTMAEMAATLPLWLLFAKVAGLYDRDHRTLRHLTADELPTLLLWVLASGGLTGLLALGHNSTVFSVAMLRALAVTAAIAVCLRALARAVWRRIVPPARVGIVGNGPTADATRRKLELFRDIHAELVTELSPAEARTVVRGGDHSALDQVDRLVVASAVSGDDLLADLLAYCRDRGIKLSLVLPADHRVGSIVQVTHLGEVATLEYNTWDPSRSTMLIKRGLDFAVASVGLVVLLPLLTAIAVAVYLGDRGPVLFRQRRAGYRGKPFTIWKFRTMVIDAEERLAEHVRIDELEQPVFKLRRDPRVTRVGRLLRRFSLDELPQLVNVLRGEMSLVGPRPEQMEVVALYNPEDRFRLEAKPGMSGPMQVHGRAELGFEERLAIERDYIENISLGRDLRILALTLAAVLRRRGAF